MMFDVQILEQAEMDLRGLRVFPVDNYLVFYIPNMETEVVTVIRVMYGGRDVDNELKRHTHYEE